MQNPLECVKKLEEVGFSRAQAEAQTQIMLDTLQFNTASKQDLKDLQVATQQDISELRSEMEQGFKSACAEMEQGFKNIRLETYKEFQLVRSEMAQLENRLIIKLGTIVSIAIAIAVTLAKLIH